MIAVARRSHQCTCLGQTILDDHGGDDKGSCRLYKEITKSTFKTKGNGKQVRTQQAKEKEERKKT